MRIAKDKLGHLAVGAIGGGIAAAFGLLFGLAAAWWPVLAIVAAGAAGIARETWQAFTGRGAVEFADGAATAAGGAIVAIGLAWGSPMVWLYGGLLAAALIAWVKSPPPVTVELEDEAAGKAPSAEGGPTPGPRK